MHSSSIDHPVQRYFFLIPCLAIWTGVAHAQSPVPDSSSDERSLIRQGVELRQAQKDEEALRVFRRAWDLSGSGRALAQVALAEQALGRWPEAEEHLGQALAHGEEAWIAQNRKLLGEALYDIEGHLGWLELSGEAKQGWVGINGKRVATLPVKKPLRVPAGSVAVEVQAEGFLPILRVVVVPSRGLAREPLAFVSTAVAPLPRPREPAADRTEARGWRSRQIVGAGLAVAAVGALTMGVTFHLVRQDRARSYKELGCESAAPSTSFEECQSRYDGISHATTLAVTGYAGTVLLSGVAAYLLWGGTAGQPATSTVSTLRCTPWDLRGVLCRGQF
jgi:hypothetical protein